MVVGRVRRWLTMARRRHEERERERDGCKRMFRGKGVFKPWYRCANVRAKKGSCEAGARGGAGVREYEGEMKEALWAGEGGVAMVVGRVRKWLAMAKRRHGERERDGCKRMFRGKGVCKAWCRCADVRGNKR